MIIMEILLKMILIFILIITWFPAHTQRPNKELCQVALPLGRLAKNVKMEG
jgi:hypothetical protein